MRKENADQRALRLWIQSGLQIPEVCELRGDAGYIFNNMIAKYTLAASTYRISEAAAARLRRDGFDLAKTHLRAHLYGKSKPTAFEHAIPATVVREALLSSSRSATAVKAILGNAGPVVIVLREEDDLLRKAGLNSKMPAGWTWGSRYLARYAHAGIPISRSQVKVRGAIKR